MRKLLVILAITLLPSFAVAAHGPGGHMGGWGGGHMSGGWGGHRMGGWHASNWHRAHFFHHGRFVHRQHFFVRRHHRFFFVGGPIFAAGYGYDCWRWVPTAWSPRRVWVCGDYY